MFWKKDSNNDELAKSKALLGILTRRLLMAYPEARVAIELVCSEADGIEGETLIDVIEGAIENHSSIMEKDPYLLADIKAILILMNINIDGSAMDNVDVGHIRELLDELCSIVHG